jgi:copper chaperone CopZ
MQTTKLKIEGMTCPKCAARVEKALTTVPGVQRATVSLAQGARVEHNGVAIDDLKQAVAKAGAYQAEVSG